MWLNLACWQDAISEGFFSTFLLERVIQTLWSILDITSAHRSVICKVVEGNGEKRKWRNRNQISFVYRDSRMVAKLVNANPTIPISCHSNQILRISERTSFFSFSRHIQLAASYLPSSYLASFPLASLAPPLLSLAPKTR